MPICKQLLFFGLMAIVTLLDSILPTTEAASTLVTMKEFSEECIGARSLADKNCRVTKLETEKEQLLTKRHELDMLSSCSINYACCNYRTYVTLYNE